MKLIGRTWAIVALPVISIVLSVIVGSLVIIFSEWLVAGHLDPGLSVKAYGALLNGSVAVEWAFMRQAYAGLGYNYYKYKLTAAKTNAKGKFDYRFDGPALYVGWAF